MKQLFLTIGLLAVLAFVLPLFAGENLIVNGDFESGIEGWSGWKLVPGEKGEYTAISAPSVISWETKDTVASSKGSLRVSLKFSSSDERGYSHNSGATVKFKESVPKNSVVKVSLYAKKISGPDFLYIGRTHGGNFTTVEVSDEWKRYEVELSLSQLHPSSDIIFNLVKDGKSSIQRLVEGEFLLDNVVIEVEEEENNSPGTF